MKEPARTLTESPPTTSTRREVKLVLEGTPLEIAEALAEVQRVCDAHLPGRFDLQPILEESAPDPAQLERMREAEETMEAIRSGEVDALIIDRPTGAEVYTLGGAEKPYRVMVEAMTEGAAALLMDGTIAYANPRMAEMLAVPVVALPGQRLQEFVSEGWRAVFEGLMREAHVGPSRGELELCTSDGTVTPALVSLTRLEGDDAPWLCMVATDLAEHRRNEEVVEAEQLARSILDQALEAIVVLDEAGRVVRANRRAHELCGANPLFQGFGDVFLTDPPALQLFARVIAGETLRQVEVRLGARTLLLSAGALVGRTGSHIGTVVTMVDISDRKLIEQELRRTDRRKDEFLGMLAHELRNPLAPIRNAVELMRVSPRGTFDLSRARGVIDRQVTHMSRLVDDLLDASRISSGKVRILRERVQLATIVTRACEAVVPFVEARKHALRVAHADRPVWVMGDVTRLAQVVSNLLHNAAKYTEPGGRITLTTAQEGDEAVISIEDTGLGIPADMFEQVFELFVQLDHSIHRTEGGLGIGLTLVKSIAELHGGRVTVSSEGPGRGSRFVVRLPALVEGPVEGSGAPRASTAVVPRRILLVDDNVDSTDTLSELLQEVGHAVSKCYDGLTALPLEEQHRPDVVLLDIGLPGMDGYEVARALRRRGCKATIIAVSGYGREQDIARGKEAGFDIHLVKPLDFARLSAILDELPHA